MPTGAVLKRNYTKVFGILLFMVATYSVLWEPQINSNRTKFHEAENERIKAGLSELVMVEKKQIFNYSVYLVNKFSVVTRASSTRQWLHKRQDRLNKSHQRKVLLFCYMRGGSSLLSELFAQNPDVMFWYEPLDGLYSGTYGLHRWSIPMHTFFDQAEPNIQPSVRKYTAWEKSLVSQFHHNLVNCKYGELPVDVLAHTRALNRSTKMEGYQHCQQVHQLQNGPCGTGEKIWTHGLQLCGTTVVSANMRQCVQKLAVAKQRYNDPTSALVHYRNLTHSAFYSEAMMKPFYKFAKCQYNLRTQLTELCIPGLIEKCKDSKVIAYKALRLTMDSVQEILEGDPDTLVIYLVRDPRAIISSTKEAVLLSRYSGPSRNLSIEAKHLCSKMIHDLELYDIFKQLYPGALRLIKYEDLARDPRGILRQLYEDIGVAVHPNVPAWVQRSQQSMQSRDDELYSTNRTDWTASINKWKSLLSAEQVSEISHICREVLQYLDYKLTRSTT